MKNIQQKNVYLCFFLCIFFILSTICSLSFFREIKPFGGLLIMISLLGAGTTFFCIFLFRKRAKTLQVLLDGDYIAHWIYTKPDWQNFLKQEYTLRKEEKKGIFFLLSSITIPIFIVFILLIDEAQMIMFLVLLGLLALYAFLAFVLPIIQYALRNKEGAEVYLGKHGVLIDREFHNWNGTFSKFVSIKQKSSTLLEITYEFFDRFGPRNYKAFLPLPSQKTDIKKLLNVFNS